MGNLLKMVNNSTILGFWDEASDFLSNILGSILWVFCDIFFVILDLFETVFKKFAGIDTNVTSASGEVIEGDLVLYLIQSNLVQQIFMSIFILSLFLLIIFTILATVKNQYADKQEPVSKIINGSFKALFMYLLVPAATVVCLIVGNIVLQAIDGATKLTDRGGASDMLFSCATYNANRLRSGTTEDKVNQLENMIDDGYLSTAVQDEIENLCNVDLSDTDTYWSADFDLMAQIVDEAFIAQTIAGSDKLDKWNFAVVNNYYYALKISYIIIWIGGGFMIFAIGKISWGLIARLFKMTLYYAISPAVMATFPIDNGKALGSWRGEMVKLGTSAYCAIGVLNVLYSILPFFNDIDLFGDGVGGTGLASAIVRLFIYIIAFSSAKDLINTISGWFGTGNAFADGENAKNMVKNAPKKLSDSMAKKAVGVGGAFTGFIGAYGEAKSLNEGKKIAGLRNLTAGLGGAFTGSGLRDATGMNFNKTIKDIQGKKDDAAKQYKDSKSMFNKDNKEFFELKEATEKQTKETEKLIKALENAQKLEIKNVEQLHADGKIDAVELSSRKDEIEKRYESEKIKARSSMEFMNPLYETRIKALEGQQEGLNSRKDEMREFFNWQRTQTADATYKTQFENFSGLGFKLTAEEWKKVKSGDFKDLAYDHGLDDEDVNNLRSVISSFSGLAENDANMNQSIQYMESLIAQGKEDTVKSILGDSNITITDGKIDITNSEGAFGSIKDASDNLDKELGSVKQSLKDLKKEASDFADSFMSGAKKLREVKKDIDEAKK